MSLMARLRNAAGEIEAAKKDGKGKFACPRTHSQVTDDQDHFPLDTPGRARNALARVAQYKGRKPKWWSGSLAQLVALIKRKVKQLYPFIDVSK